MRLLWSILRQAAKHPLRTAVIDDQRQYNYATLVIGAFKLADEIDRLTTARHVGLMLPTSGLFPMALLATWILGKVAVPLNYLLSPEELAYVIRDSDIDAVLTVGPMLEMLGEQGHIPPGVQTVCLEQLDLRSDFPSPRWPALPEADDLAVLLYTSGTSGKPKGVMLSHGNLAFDVQAAIEHARLTVADTFLGVLPQFHSFGLTALTLMPLYLGSRVVYTARFVPRRLVQLIRKHRPDIFMAVPSMYGALLSVKDAKPEDFASVRLPISGGEPLPQSLYDDCRERLGMTLLEGYGLTETSPVASWATPDRNRPHSVGQPLPGVRVLILDEHQQIQGPDVEGEIIIAGPNVMLGYYKLPELTREVLTQVTLPDAATRRGSLPGALPGVPGRAFRTGDIGRVDAEGYLYITGRKKEMLIIAGENVFPREIEEVINQHPAVRASAVVGRHDPLRGEIPIAYVECEEGQQVDEAELRQFCRERLAQYKVPREVVVMEQLPRNATGKILRRALGKELKVEG